MTAIDEVLATLREEHRREQVLITISTARSAAIVKAIAALDELGESGRVVKRPVEPVATRPVGAPPKRAIARQSAKPKRATNRPPAATPRRAGRPTKWDFAEVAKVANAANERGTPMAAAIVAAFGCSDASAGWAISEARKKGHTIAKGNVAARSGTPRGTPRSRPLDLAPSPPFTTEPITKVPFDPQKVRDEQAGPSQGRPPGYVESTREPAAEKPAPPARPAFSIDDAERAIAATG